MFDCRNTRFYTQNEKDYLTLYKSFLYILYYVIFFEKIVYDTLEYDVLSNNIYLYFEVYYESLLLVYFFD